MEVLDREHLLHNVDGDRALLEEIVRLFFDSSVPILESVRAAVTRADADTLHKSAHQLKGALANVGAKAAAAAANELESLGRRGTMTGLEQALATLETELERLTPCLERLLNEPTAPIEP